MSSDPIGYPLGLDLYGYANGDPVNYRDPDGRFFSEAYQKMGAVVINTLNNPRFQGSVQAFGGLVEAGVGAGMTYTTSGFAAPLGWPVMAHGLDHFITGVSTAISGRSRDSATAQLLYKTGFSAETSRSIDNCMGFFGTLGGTAFLAQKGYSALDGLKFPNGSKVENGGIQKILTNDIIHVTPQGVTIPAEVKYQIPSHYVENLRRLGSYGEYMNGKFVEKLRIDPATPSGMKGPNYSHYHLNGKATHYSPLTGSPNPGFFP